MKLRHCPHCANKGVLRLCYRSAEPFDLVVCDCPAGQFWRKAGAAMIREVMRVSESCEVIFREDVDDVEAVEKPAGEGYTAAGQTGKRAKL